MRRVRAVATRRATPLCCDNRREADGADRTGGEDGGGAHLSTGMTGGPGCTRQRRRTFLFMGGVGWNGPPKLACYTILARLSLDPDRLAEIG